MGKRLGEDLSYIRRTGIGLPPRCAEDCATMSS